MKPEKGKSAGEDRSVFVSPLEPLEGFLGFFSVFRMLQSSPAQMIFPSPSVVPNPAKNTESGVVLVKSVN